jgi:hypothetical protein
MSEYGDRIGDALRADAGAAREEIRAAGLTCPSCGENAADLIGRHGLVLALFGMDRTVYGQAECRDGAPVILDTYELARQAANIALLDDFQHRMAVAERRDITGTGPARFTGLLGVLKDGKS